MATDLNDAYELSYAGVPFVLDRSTIVRLHHENREGLDPRQQAPSKHQPEPDLIDELNRRLPTKYLNEFAKPRQFLKGNLSMLAWPYEVTYPNVGIGEFFYPTTASRWACGRFLATSSQVKKMVAKAMPAAGIAAQKFVMKVAPVGAAESSNPDASYKVETDLFMLPPRPLAEIGGDFDGLFLVTLVDERWYWQSNPTRLKPYDTTSWSSLVQDVLDDLGITATYDSTTISSTYLQPQQDSQLWVEEENAAHLLDAILWNIGRTFVRKLDGTYELLDTQASLTLVESNRGEAEKVVLSAGGDIFYAGTELNFPQRTAGSFTGTATGKLLNGPDLRRAILPKEVKVSFPYYVTGDDPVPHSLNPRYRPKRPSCWYEPKPGEVYSKTVALTGTGLANGGTHYLYSTAKALIAAEADLGTPTNQTALDALATRLASDHVDMVAGSALDESYPGTFVWDPEGVNDIVWTYSAKSRQASTRVFRQEWNQFVREFQHAEGVPPKGVGGPSVAQTWTDGQGGDLSGTVQTTVSSGTLLSGGYKVVLLTQDNFPTQNRWVAEVDPGAGTREFMYMEGTSGDLTVDIVHRGIYFTSQQEHGSGATVYAMQPNVAYGVNAVRSEKMQAIFPGQWTSGGVQEAVIVPQTQTVQCLTGSGALIRSITSYSGRVFSYDPTKASGSQLIGLEYVWLQHRNPDPHWPLYSGWRYDGQWAGPSASGGSGSVAPLYIVNEERWRPRTIRSGGTAEGVTSGYHGPEPKWDIRVSGLGGHFYSAEFPASGVNQIYLVLDSVISGVSGSIIKGMIGSGAVCSGKIASGSVNSGNYSSGSVPTDAYSSGSVLAHHTGSGLVTGQSGIVVEPTLSGYMVVASGILASGVITSGMMGENTVVRSSIASGQVCSGTIGNACISSGMIGSGQIASGHMASGFVGNLIQTTTDSSALTGDAYAEIATITGAFQLGAIKNTSGVNDLKVKHTTTDAWGVAASLEVVVAAGAFNKYFSTDLANQIFTGTTAPPVVSVKYEVKSNVGGSPTGYRLIIAKVG